MNSRTMTFQKVDASFQYGPALEFPDLLHNWHSELQPNLIVTVKSEWKIIVFQINDYLKKKHPQNICLQFSIILKMSNFSKSVRKTKTLQQKI